MGRNIGSRIIEACEIVEQHGGCSSVVVTPLMGTAPTNTIKFLRNAVRYGLLTVNRGVRPHQYTAIPGWREKTLPKAQRKPEKTKEQIDKERLNARDRLRKFHAKNRAAKIELRLSGKSPLSSNAGKESIVQCAIRTQPSSIWAYAQQQGSA